LLGVLAALADALAVIGIPGAGFLDHVGFDAEVDQFADLLEDGDGSASRADADDEEEEEEPEDGFTDDVAVDDES
jgi:hypothetical protein